MKKIKKCCGEWPGVGQVNLIGNAVIITCHKCKRQVWKNSEVHGQSYWEQAVEEWNKGVK